MAASVHLMLLICRYVQAAAFLPWYRKSFGYPLMYNISGTLHTHVIAWKVDLDIGGTANSVNIHNLKVR
jgi:Cu2+-containing amine oxidase